MAGYRGPTPKLRPWPTFFPWLARTLAKRPWTKATRPRLREGYLRLTLAPTCDDAERSPGKAGNGGFSPQTHKKSNEHQ
jgi:hypothetical protein